MSSDGETKMRKIVEKARNERRPVMNHICVRVEDIEKAEKLFEESFGIRGFVREEGDLFKGERAVSHAWVSDEMMIELMEPQQKQQIGYDTGCAVPIGHLSEIGFITADIDSDVARLEKLGWRVTDSIAEEGMKATKMDQSPAAGIPIELMELDIGE